MSDRLTNFFMPYPGSRVTIPFITYLSRAPGGGTQQNVLHTEGAVLTNLDFGFLQGLVLQGYNDHKSNLDPSIPPLQTSYHTPGGSKVHWNDLYQVIYVFRTKEQIKKWVRGERKRRNRDNRKKRAAAAKAAAAEAAKAAAAAEAAKAAKAAVAKAAEAAAAKAAAAKSTPQRSAASVSTLRNIPVLKPVPSTPWWLMRQSQRPPPNQPIVISSDDEEQKTSLGTYG